MGSKSDLNIRMITSSQCCSIVHMGITNDITCSFCQRDCINHIVLEMNERADILKKNQIQIALKTGTCSHSVKIYCLVNDSHFKLDHIFDVIIF